MSKNNIPIRPVLENGEPLVIGPGLIASFSGCCDCGLVHLQVYQRNEDGTITEFGYRDQHETDRIRKLEGIVVYKRKKK